MTQCSSRRALARAKRQKRPLAKTDIFWGFPDIKADIFWVLPDSFRTKKNRKKNPEGTHEYPPHPHEYI
jgi:hypothetical protein